jgi:hypothetical protein
MKNKTRQNEVSMASLYHRCEKYSEMIEIAKNLIKEDPNLSEMEMSVFTEGYKCKLNEIRKVLIKLLEIEKKEIKRGSTHVHLMKEILNPKITELSNLCDDFNTQIDLLISKPKNFDTMANLTRLKLDFLRYKCQFIQRGEEWQKAHDDFFNTITKIETIGKEFLSSNNINILYIQLCKCVFYYEVLNKPKEAIEMGKILLKSVLNPPKPVPKPEPKKEMVEEKESKVSINEETIESKKGDKKEDGSKKGKVSAKKRSTSKLKEEKKDEKDKKLEKEVKSTESKDNVVEGNKTIEGEKKDDNNNTKTEEKKETIEIQNEKPILTPELNQFIYILRTNIILWSGKHESDVKL